MFATPVTLKLEARLVPVRIHALLDNAWRFVLAIEARTGEREVDIRIAFCLPHAARKKRKIVDWDVVATVLENTAR